MKVNREKKREEEQVNMVADAKFFGLKQKINHIKCDVSEFGNTSNQVNAQEREY